MWKQTIHIWENELNYLPLNFGDMNKIGKFLMYTIWVCSILETGATLYYKNWLGFAFFAIITIVWTFGVIKYIND